MSCDRPSGDSLRVLPGNVEQLIATARSGTADYGDLGELIKRPVIVVSAPRSGSTLLFEQLMTIEGFWSIGGASHGIFRLFPQLRAEIASMDSGALSAGHADAETVKSMQACFAWLLRDRHGQAFNQIPAHKRPPSVTLLEKTPRNALNIPFLCELFPEARFIYLHRDPRPNIASIVEAWTLGLQSGRFVTYRDLPGWDRAGWCFLLPRGWREYIGRSLFEIAAFQWAASNDAILDNLPRDRSLTVSYESLISNPPSVIADVCRFAGVAPPSKPTAQLSLSRTTISPPNIDKWRRVAEQVAAVENIFAATADRVQLEIIMPLGS